MKTTVTSHGQTVVPAKIRKDHQIGSQTQLEWIDDGETIRVVPLPADTIRVAKGISRGLCQKLLEERALERKSGRSLCAKASRQNKLSVYVLG